MHHCCASHTVDIHTAAAASRHIIAQLILKRKKAVCLQLLTHCFKGFRRTKRTWWTKAGFSLMCPCWAPWIVQTQPPPDILIRQAYSFLNQLLSSLTATHTGVHFHLVKHSVSAMWLCYKDSSLPPPRLLKPAYCSVQSGTAGGTVSSWV